jgi:hypothetical protein
VGVAALAAAASRGGGSANLRSPTFAAPHGVADVPFSTVSVRVPLAAILAAVAADGATEPSDFDAASGPAVSITVTAVSDGANRGGCVSNVCVVVAILVGIAAAALGFAGTHIALQMRSKRRAAAAALAEMQDDHSHSGEH